MLTCGCNECRLGDRTLTVSYAEPKQSEMNQDQVKSVYVGGLTADATEQGLKDFFVSLDVGAVSPEVTCCLELKNTTLHLPETVP